VILPTKGVTPRSALLTIGAEILRAHSGAQTVSKLWEEFRRADESHWTITYDWFLLALDLLYAMGIIDFDRGRIIRRMKSTGLPK
jgi:hypothetical protein